MKIDYQDKGSTAQIIIASFITERRKHHRCVDAALLATPVRASSVGGRKAKAVTLDVKYAPVTLKTPSNKTGDAIPLYYVGCSEIGNEDNKLNW
ncbi:hypothetical protein AAY47_19110, partial [Xenorhabdus griffiniae]